MTVAIISHPDCRRHSAGPLHPDVPERLSAIEDQLIASGLEMVLRFVEAPEVQREQLARVHTQDYIDRVIGAAPSEGRVEMDGDTVMSPDTLAAARRAAGAGVRAVDGIMAGEFPAAFCNVRPPGHHAGPDRAGGFCLFNNIAVAAAHALEAHQLNRVAILDFDVHHGDGTEAIFTGDERVLYCSIFQHPFYPHCGAETAEPNIVNVPLEAGSGTTEFQEGVNQHWLPALAEFRPEFVLISAGFDGHLEDDMSHLRLTETDFGWVTSRLREVAERHCQGRIMSMLEGGYVLQPLARSARAHIDALIG